MTKSTPSYLNKCLGLLIRPLHFSLFLGVVIGTLFFTFGTRSISQAKKVHLEELSHLTEQWAYSYRLLKEDNSTPWQIKELLNQTLIHPLIQSATLFSAENHIISHVNKAQIPNQKKLHQWNYPIIKSDGSPFGKITLGINWNQSQLLASLKKQMALYTLGGLIFGFLVCWIVLKHGESYLTRFKKALEKVNSGQLDDDLHFNDNKEWQSLATSFNEMLESLRERDRMRHSLGRIMDPKIAEILIKENPKLGGLRRKASILFCDIRNYTSICEQMSVDELQEFLNEYWKGTVEIIMDQEGTIDKFHGDGVCVIFGAPNLHEDDPLRAVRTAVRLVKNVEDLNKRRMAQRKIPIQIGIGIHTGEVIAGNIGSERRMDYTVVGDVVNVAARIEELNKKYGTKILISDSVYEKVESNVRVKTLSLAHLRGHKRPILVHALREFIEVPANPNLADLPGNPDISPPQKDEKAA